jgi:DNA-binding PucR family transcriptional regulator
LRKLGATDVLTLSVGQTSVWAWGRGDAVRDGVGENLSLEPGLFAAVGGAGDDLDGFVRSHHDAVQARRMAGLLSRRPGSVISYRAVALTSLIATDPGQAARFVDDELGDLAGDSDSMRRLRATLAVYFDEAMRPVRTARRLGVHQNTVLYRVQQVEQILGRPVADRRLELETALRLADARDALRSAPHG